MPNRQDFIPDDGYTEEGYIKAVPQIHNALRFTFRPLLWEERTRMLAAADAATDKGQTDKYDRQIATMLSKHLTSWSLTDGRKDEAKEVPINVDIIRRLKPKLALSLYYVVMGLQASDIDPDWPEEKKSEFEDLELEAELEGKPVAFVAEQASLGN